MHETIDMWVNLGDTPGYARDYRYVGKLGRHTRAMHETIDMWVNLGDTHGLCMRL